MDVQRSQVLHESRIGRKLLPEPWPHAWKITAASEKDAFVLAIQNGRRISHAEFFPLEPNQIRISPSQCATRSRVAIR